MDTGTPTFISADTVKNILDYPSLIQVIESALGHFSKRNEVGIIQPVRTAIHVRKNEGYFGCMPVYSEMDNILCTKLVSFFVQNKDIQTHHAVILVFSADTGAPRAIMDGDIITSRRTAAASAVATKHLGCENPKILAILGSGVLARTHYDALSQLFKFEEVRIWNHRFEGAQKLAAEIGEKCVASASVEEAVLDADVIVTVTSSKVPVLKAQYVKTGAHINAVGACRPDWSEVDPELMKSAIIYTDSFEGALKESGDILLAKAEVYAEIGEVINGTKEGKRDQVTVFKSLGIAIEDAVAAKLVLDKLGY
uniref:Ketimine reductase mu-crystallin n=1 Tax=Arion vulgaris TaxID=1028688 RepID=A0A0B7A802_9EUPU